MATQSTRAGRWVGLGSAGIMMTPAEFDSLTRSDDRFRYELIHGVLVVTRLPSLAECDPNQYLGHMLLSYQEEHPQGATLNATFAERYVYTKDSRRRADRVIWAGLGRLPNEEEDVPTIVVEFVSRGKRDFLRDYEEKKAGYLALGVTEYWVIDRFRRVMTVFRNAPAGLLEQVIGETETYHTDVLPGFELPLARLFALADQWKKPR
jgi:Uma2 family endonuclease